jgi:hypothetical protein
MKDRTEAFRHARICADQSTQYISVVRVRNGQFMIERTTFLSADYKYYERWDFAPTNKWPSCRVCGHISQMHDADGNCEEKNCRCTGYRTMDEPWKTPKKQVDAKFIMDCYGHFCIEVDGVKSSPVGYEAVAVLTKSDGTLYIGVSQCYVGILPTECVLEAKKIKSVLTDADVCNLYQPEQECTHLETKANNRIKKGS